MKGFCILIRISLKFVPKGPITPAGLVEIMAWRRQAMSHHLNHCWPDSLTQTCSTRGRWVECKLMIWWCKGPGKDGTYLYDISSVLCFLTRRFEFCSLQLDFDSTCLKICLYQARCCNLPWLLYQDHLLFDVKVFTWCHRHQSPYVEIHPAMFNISSHLVYFEKYIMRPMLKNYI